MTEHEPSFGPDFGSPRGEGWLRIASDPDRQFYFGEYDDQQLWDVLCSMIVDLKAKNSEVQSITFEKVILETYWAALRRKRDQMKRRQGETGGYLGGRHATVQHIDHRQRPPAFEKQDPQEGPRRTLKRMCIACRKMWRDRMG